MGFGRGIGLPMYLNGEIVGNTINSLAEQQMPTHTHAAAFHPSSTPGGTASVSISLDDATSTTPINGGYLAKVVKGGGAADKDEKIYMYCMWICPYRQRATDDLYSMWRRAR